MKYMFITGAPAIARHAESCGVQRIFADMEVLGKAERQGHLDTHKAAHTLDDVARLRDSLSDAELMVRINPLHEGTQGEVDALAQRGVDRLMLPMFFSAEEVARFKQIVAGRMPVTLLAETPASLVRLQTLLPHLEGGDQIHFGLNDLSLGMGLDFLFEPMAASLFDLPASMLCAHDIPFGIGGIARVGQGDLPADYVMGEHVRLRSQHVILSRAFRDGDIDLAAELDKLRDLEARWLAADDEALFANHERLATRVFEIAGRIRRERG